MRKPFSSWITSPSSFRREHARFAAVDPGDIGRQFDAGRRPALRYSE